jgi:hypothetical protein
VFSPALILQAAHVPRPYPLIVTALTWCCSSVIAIAEHCPAALSRDNWWAALGSCEFTSGLHTNCDQALQTVWHTTRGLVADGALICCSYLRGNAASLCCAAPVGNELPRRCMELHGRPLSSLP